MHKSEVSSRGCAVTALKKATGALQARLHRSLQWLLSLSRAEWARGRPPGEAAAAAGNAAVAGRAPAPGTAGSVAGLAPVESTGPVRFPAQTPQHVA